MPITPMTKTERANWREMLSPASSLQIGLAAALFLFSMFALPLSAVNTVCELYLLVGLAFCIFLTRAFGAVVTVAAPALFLASLSYFLFPTMPLVIPTVYAAALLGAGAGAFLILHSRTPSKFLPLLLLPLLGYLVPLFLTRDPILSLAALVPAVLAAVIGYCLLTCRPLTPSVLLITAVVVLIALGAWLVAVAVTGWPSDGLVAELVRWVRGAYIAYYENFESLLASYGSEMGGIQNLSLYGSSLDFAMPTEKELQSLVYSLSTLLPGLFAATALIFSFATWRFALRFLTCWRTIPRLPDRLHTVTVSTIGAGVFLAVYICSVLSADSLFGTVCTNLSLCLSPALALVGFASLLDRKKGRSCLSILLVFALLFVMMSNVVLGISLAAFVGAFHTLLARFLPPYNKGDS